ncbi:MAG: hypothetical protein AB7G93_02650 [Bdellovibrionales bacterium]
MIRYIFALVLFCVFARAFATCPAPVYVSKEDLSYAAQAVIEAKGYAVMPAFPEDVYRMLSPPFSPGAGYFIITGQRLDAPSWLERKAGARAQCKYVGTFNRTLKTDGRNAAYEHVTTLSSDLVIPEDGSISTACLNAFVEALERMPPCVETTPK